jgi:hypothetical protein
MTDFLLMAACGVIAAVATFLLTNAYRSAQANIVTVFEYTGMIWGPLVGLPVLRRDAAPHNGHRHASSSSRQESSPSGTRKSSAT